MKNVYEDECWAVDLPSGWSGQADEEEPDTALIGAAEGCGLLQIRAFRSDGRDIEKSDLEHLAAHHIEKRAQLYRVRYGSFSGFYVHYRAEENLWYEWWLRTGVTALHATYHCPVDDQAREEASVAAIMGSLRPRSS